MLLHLLLAIIFHEKFFQLSAFWSRKIGEYEYPTGEEILPSSQRQIMQQVNNKQIMQQAPFF